MNELIVIQPKQIGNEEINSVDARELHSRLGLKKDFTNWIKDNIKKLNLVENVDYVVYAQKGENLSGGRPSSEYILTLDTGKHIAMMTNTSTAHDIRTYFIEFEKKAKAKPIIHDPTRRALIQMLTDFDAMENRVALLESKSITRDESYFTVAGYCNLKGIKLDRTAMSMVGKMAAQYSRENNIKIGQVYDSRYGKVNEYHTEALQSAVTP